MWSPFKTYNKQAIGQNFEKLACAYLQKQGLTLKAKNANFRVGEIDLIMLDKKQLVFVEVRYRQSNQYGGALASITPQKQQKIIKAAQLYLQKEFSNQPPSCRFDVVAIEGDEKPYEIQWIKNAFA